MENIETMEQKNTQHLIYAFVRVIDAEEKVKVFDKLKEIGLNEVPTNIRSIGKWDYIVVCKNKFMLEANMNMLEYKIATRSEVGYINCDLYAYDTDNAIQLLYKLASSQFLDSDNELCYIKNPLNNFTPVMDDILPRKEIEVRFNNGDYTYVYGCDSYSVERATPLQIAENWVCNDIF